MSSIRLLHRHDFIFAASARKRVAKLCVNPEALGVSRHHGSEEIGLPLLCLPAGLLVKVYSFFIQILAKEEVNGLCRGLIPLFFAGAPSSIHHL